ncbi:mannan endo-1,4-beta-mannosidase [Alteromonadaceae bacterium Bs31]|nr:mannan endo-1,4-beta-mannosidase [Alteromonadaceae bacterium Bs31]
MTKQNMADFFPANYSKAVTYSLVSGVLAIVSVLSACSPPPEEAVKVQQHQHERPEKGRINDSPFVNVQGNRFYADGDPYRFVGANVWYAAYLGSENDDIGDRERLARELDLLKANGVTNLRIMAASENSPLDNSLSPAISNKGEIEREDILLGLDYTLVEMAKRKMKAVLFLNNFWEWSGGMVTYLSWVNDGKFINLGDPAHPWPEFSLYSAEFYRNAEAIEIYHQYIEQLLERTNTITGVAYKDDPTIMSWQLANEPRPGEGKQSEQYMPQYLEWIASTAKLIKKHAPDQLVSLGSEGTMGCLGSVDCFKAAHAIEEIDYSTFHMWPKNWGWYDVKDPSSFPAVIKNAGEYIELHIKLAKELNKPIVLEEFGLERDLGEFSPESSAKMRENFYQYVFSFVNNSVHEGGPFVGTNFWAWGGYGKASHQDARWRAGDKSFVGDPPQEPQGLNSVFASDERMLQILKAHSDILLNSPR